MNREKEKIPSLNQMDKILIGKLIKYQINWNQGYD